MWDKLFFFEEIVILIRTHRFIIYYITRVPLQNDITFVVVDQGYKD